MSKIPYILTFGTGLLGLFASPAIVLAADDTTTNNSPIEIIITAGRKAQQADETLAAVSVISQADIKRSQAQTVSEVLSSVPGLSFSNSGGTGKQTSVYLRGSNADHVLVLIDGVKIGSATLGSTPFEFLPLSQVERIEVVRGPRSSLYGSEAIGGVIQIFTRKGSKNGFKPQASISYGSNNTRKADVNLSGGNGNSWFNINAATERTDGFNALDSYLDFPPPDFAPVTVFETDNDGFSSDSFSFRAGHDFGNRLRAEISALRSQGENEFDGGFQNEGEFVQQATSAKLTAPMGQRSTLTAQVGQSRDESDNFKDGVYSSSFDTKRNTASLQGETKLGASNLVYGIDFQKDNVGGSTAYSVDSRKNTGIFGSYQTKLGSNTFEAAVRQDDNEQFGTHTTGSVAIGHEFSNGMQIRGSYGNAFKAPTFNDLYWPDDGFFSGNSSLKPEKAKTVEFGINGKLAQGRWSINAFQTKVDDLIAYVSDPVTFVGTMENVDQAKMRGIELEMGTVVQDWKLSANATFQKTENQSGANAGNKLARRPDRILNLNVDRRFGPMELGATLHAESGRFMDAGNFESTAGFTTVDLRGKYQIAKDWSVAAKIGNLLDKEYETVKGYNQDGINGLLTLEYNPR